MKIKEKDYKELESAINDVLEEIPDLKNYLMSRGDFNAVSVRWHLYHLANMKKNHKFSRNGGLYDYLNDSNIDTALRKITGLTDNPQ